MSDQSVEYVNPVPEARWDKRRSQKFKAFAAILGAIAAIGILRVAWTVLEVAHGVTFVTDIAGLTNENEPSANASFESATVADGASNLPGDYARLTFTALPQQTEYWEREDKYGPYGSSRWGLATAEEGRMNQLDLTHVLLAPMDDPIAALNQKFRSDHAADKVVGPRELTVDGRDGAQWTATGPNGDKTIATWFFGPVHSFRVECDVLVGATEYERQCQKAVRSLRFER